MNRFCYMLADIDQAMIGGVVGLDHSIKAKPRHA